jgi:hypothetical protein
MSECLPSRAMLLDGIERQATEIKRLVAVVAQLQARIAELESELARLAGGGAARPPGWVKANTKARTSEKKGRKKRATNFARKRSDQPTQQLVHGVERCARCVE